jgi:hypothetical protein
MVGLVDVKLFAGGFLFLGEVHTAAFGMVNMVRHKGAGLHGFSSSTGYIVFKGTCSSKSRWVGHVFCWKS